MLTALSVLTSPVTQQVWTWDRYLHGGQDFESGVLLILVSFCLLLVMAQHLKQTVDSILAAWRMSSHVANRPCTAARAPVPCLAGNSFPRPLRRSYCLPLTI